jgi:sugar/nucleoside kinase (ribokinase family)
MASVCVIGELNFDLIVLGAGRFPRPGEEMIVDEMVLTLGSSSAIIACQLARLGDDVLFISKVGGDDFGRSALESLRKKGVSTEAIMVDDSLDTGLTISVAIGGERAMMTVMGSIQELRYDDIDFELLKGRAPAQHVHISSFFLQQNLRPDIWRIFQKARQMGLTTSLDTGWPHDREQIADLASVWPHLDVFLPNEVEAMALSGRPTVEEALPVLAEQVSTVVVKLGAQGAVVQRGAEVLRQPSFVVDVVETTGAGDSFNGGFIHGYMAGMDLAHCLDLGLACGGLSTRAAGGTTTQPTLEEATEFIRTAARRMG